LFSLEGILSLSFHRIRGPEQLKILKVITILSEMLSGISHLSCGFLVSVLENGKNLVLITRLNGLAINVYGRFSL
jgi:hypothetical protein